MKTSRPIDLRRYQEPAFEYLKAHDKSIIAMAPGGGKTIITIKALVEYLTLNPLAKVIIFPHNTNILKYNFIDQLDSYGIPYSTVFDDDYQIHVCLPQNERHIKGYYDLLIMDEAHQNYLATQVQRIIVKITRPDSILKEWLLTGTPSKFVRKGGYNIYILAMCDIPEENFSKLNFELVATNYNWIGQYNDDLELKASCIMTKNDNEESLKAVVKSLFNRLKGSITPKDFNFPDGIIPKIKSWVNLFLHMKKTMIVCKRIEQANDINRILLSKGINSAVSNSENDTDSKVIEDFKKGMYNVLVVVNRGVLGFDDINLYNVIDMSGTHNPNRIYQMFARVIRGTQDMSKFYIKVTTHEAGMKDLTRACMNASLMLTHRGVIATYNESNFNGIVIPIIKQPKTKKITGDKKFVKINKTEKLVFPEFTNDVIKLVKSVIADFDNATSIFGKITMAEVRRILMEENLQHSDEEIFSTL